MDGIENLGTGLLQGYQFGLQQKRQQQQDDRQATLDQQNTEQHNLAMQTNQFNLDQAQKKSVVDEATQARTVNFNKTLQQAVLMNKSGNPQGAFSTLVQGNNSDPKSAYNLEFLGMGDDGKGKIRYIDRATGKAIGEGAMGTEDAIVTFAHSLDPAKELDAEQAKKDKEAEAATKLAAELAKQKEENKGKLGAARIAADASAADNATTLKNTQMQLDAGKYEGKDGKNKFNGSYLFKQGEGIVTQAEADLLDTRMKSQASTVQSSDNPAVRVAAFNSLFNQAKEFAGKVLRKASVKEQEDYAKTLTARQFGDGEYSYDDLYRAIVPAKTTKKPGAKANPLATANKVVSPANPQQKTITGLNGGITQDPKVKNFLFGQ